MLLEKYFASHFELVAPHDSQTEMEDIFPTTYPHSSHLTGWLNSLDQFLSKAEIIVYWVGFLDDTGFYANARHKEIKAIS